MHPVDYRLPAEWERQSALLLAWPFAGGDWDAVLDPVQEAFRQFIATVLEHQNVVLVIQPGNRDARARLGHPVGLKFVEAPYNDTWCRDYGPITLCNAGRRLALDFNFDGWGGRHEARLDNRVNTHLAHHELFSDFDFRQSLFELEGGAIECDGNGTVLINRHCLRARHPHLDEGEIDHELKAWLNASRLLGIDMPPIAGDDTDGHIDTLARFVARDTIVFQTLDDADATRRLTEQLELLRSDTGRAYELVALPRAEDIDAGLAASYANFVLINGAVLVPAYGSRADAQARELLSGLFPDRVARSIDSRTLVSQGGGPHCACMQIPAALA